ncbi:MAG: rhodanese-like domain-containing protein [Deltaproteobacteria bacterium]|nr:rhodanese-like domain-containing protein [Deltaproteobacteria bacterium]
MTRVGESASGRIVGTLLLLALASCGPPPEGGDGGTPDASVTIPEGPISGADLQQRIEAGLAPFILDVRTPSEYAGGHVPGALNLPHDTLASRLGEVPASPGEELVVYCHGGSRASAAETVLVDAGYLHVRLLEGHWSAWSQDGRPTE